MRAAVCPGSFDPPTLGHLDIIRRAAAIFELVYVAVLDNPAKRPAFSPEERRTLMERALNEAGIANARVESFAGLTVDYARRVGASAIVRGIRGAQDIPYEQGLEAANKYLAAEVETVYLAARPELAFISSSAVREIASHGRDIGGLVPGAIKNIIAERLNRA